MPRGKAQDPAILEMALIGYELERKKIEEKIREIRSQLGGRRVQVSETPAAAAPRKKRTLSPAARKRIALAQKRRWAEHRKKQAGDSK